MNPEITRTIYSICYPQSQQVLAQLLARQDLHEMYHETWSKKQDVVHEEFFAVWRQWIAKRFSFDDAKLKFFYPSNGSSEAIREQLALLHSQGKRLVVFEAEYEGYEAIAKALGMEVKKINRFLEKSMVDAQLEQLNSAQDVFFITQPSSIDGMHWCGFNDFMEKTQDINLPVYLDIAQVGASRQEYVLDVSKYDHVHGVFFSLSKIFGVYYHRIGGVLLKDKNDLLYGNMWFKNLLALEYGKALMQALPIGFFDDKLQDYQKKACQTLKEKYRVDFIPSDVYVLSNVAYAGQEHQWQRSLQRSDCNPLLRVCMSPLMESFIRTQTSPECCNPGKMPGQPQ